MITITITFTYDYNYYYYLLVIRIINSGYSYYVTKDKYIKIILHLKNKYSSSITYKNIDVEIENVFKIDLNKKDLNEANHNEFKQYNYIR